MARILLIDDDGLFRDMAKAALVEGGFEVAEAADGKAGVEAFKAGAFDLVIVDMYMPGQDGIDTIFDMDAGAKGIPVLAVTGGHTMGSQSLRLAESAGADLAMEKDFTPEQLVAAVKGLIEKGKKKG
jgi:two-component system response regulator HydG